MNQVNSRSPNISPEALAHLGDGQIAYVKTIRSEDVQKQFPQAPELAPGLRIPARTPPIFLAHGGDDIVSPPEHSVVMYLALKQAGVPAELHLYATAAHDFGVRPSDHPCSTWTRSCAEWLRHQGFLKTGQ